MIMARSWGTSGFMQFSSFHSNLILWAVYGCTLTATWNLAYGIVGSDCFQTDNGQSDCAGNRWWEQSASLPYRTRNGAVDPSYVKGHKGTEGEDWSIQKAILGRNNSCSRGIKWRASCPGWRTSEAATSISYRALFDWQFLCEHTMIGESVVCKNTQVSPSLPIMPHIFHSLSWLPCSLSWQLSWSLELTKLRSTKKMHLSCYTSWLVFLFEA